MNEQNEESTAVHEARVHENFWLKAASFCFGLWALMIPLGVKMILDRQADQQVTQIATAARLDALVEQFRAYRELDQTQMALVKDRQDAVIERQKAIMVELAQLRDRR
jgi:hypothetical protein